MLGAGGASDDDDNDDKDKKERVPMVEDEPVVGDMDPNIVRKVNTHQRMLAKVEMEMKNISDRARRDREEGRLLREEVTHSAAPTQTQHRVPLGIPLIDSVVRHPALP